MTNNEILQQVTLLGKEFSANVEKKIVKCKPINGVQRIGTNCCIVPASLMIKYQNWDPSFFDCDSQISAVKKVIAKHMTDPIRMVVAIEKMVQTKKAGDVRLNPNMLDILYGILDEVKKVGEVV